MSYCRFSTDDFQCDVYCFGSNGGIEIYVASNRYVYKEPLPAPVPFEESTIAEWTTRHNKVIAMVDQADRVDIGGPHDGEHEVFPNYEDAITYLQQLHEDGYNFPLGVIDEIREEYRGEIQ